MKIVTMTVAALGCAALTAETGDAIGNVGEIKLKGYLGARLDSMIAGHVGGTDVDYITACFQEKTERRGWWQTEFWGKYMHSAVPYSVYSGSPKLRADIEHGIDRILASQEKSGYIGNYPDELRCGNGWDVWGMKYTLMGLMHYYDLLRAKAKGEGEGRCERALTAARRLCDYVIGEIGPNGKRGRPLWRTGRWTGYASSSILEPVVWLYRRTQEKKYLDFATYIVKGMSEPEAGPRLVDLALKGVSVADRNGYGNNPETNGGYQLTDSRLKAYEMMSCYQGLLDFVEEMVKVEGEGQGLGLGLGGGLGGGRGKIDDLRRAAVMTAEDIVREEVNLAGGCASSEVWFHGAKKQFLPYIHPQETCVTITWMRLCEKLLEVTGDAKWADQIERTFYNAYLGALKPDGSMFAAYTPLNGYRWRGMDHCYMHTDCCTSNGPRGFLGFLRKFCVRTADTTTFNFYATALVPGFDMYSLYPRNGYARLVSHTTGRRNVRLRVPGWCPKAVVKVNGKEVTGESQGGYVTLAREWILGDVVEISFEMPVVAHVIDHNIAFTRGPILLARDSRFGDGDLAEPLRRGLRDGQVMETFDEIHVPSSEMWMAFAATLPIGPHTENPEQSKAASVRFCDYATAGSAWRADNYYRTWFPIEYSVYE